MSRRSHRNGGRDGGRGAGRGRKNDESGGESAGLTAFNMNDENDEGHFDDDGNFVWNKEDKRVQEEAWLDDVSEEVIGAALHAKNQREFRDEQGVEMMTEERANSILSTLLNSRETVLQALQRLGSKRPKNRGTKRKQSQAKDAAPVAAQTAEEKEQFEQITEAADFLMRQGEVDVYSQIKEEFMDEDALLAERRAAGRVTFAAESAEEESKSEERPPPQKPEIQWEYRGADGQIHGPFPSSSFVTWQQQGYFTGDSAVDIRQVRGEEDKVNSEEKEGEQADNAPEEPKPEPEKLSAEQELLNDFEDSEDEEDKPKPVAGGENGVAKEEAKQEDANPWERSDQIDFSSY